jgi:riboflavin synthase alpha subunit
VDDVVSPALPIPAFSDSLQSHCALSNERIPRPTRAGRRHCRNVAMSQGFVSLNGVALTVINSQQSNSRIPVLWHDPAWLTWKN